MRTFFSTLSRRLPALVLACSGTLLTGCASFYLDPATKDVPVAEMRHVTAPKPVRVNFEFQTRGAPNSRATELLGVAVMDQVRASGLFSSVDGGPQDAVLEIKLNNVPLGDDSPAAKGIATGLTFGLVGTSVGDGYECKLSYLPAGRTTPIVKVARHAIYTTIGNASPPPNMIKTDNGQQAAQRMTHAIVSTALRDLSLDPAFNDSPTTTSN